MHNLERLSPQSEARQFKSFGDIQSNPSLEGLRPDKKYAGGDPGEIIIVAGKKYKKEVALMTNTEKINGNIDRPYTEKEYFSHNTEGVGPGPGWDTKWYLKDMGVWDLDPRHLSSFPLYDLVPLEK